MPRGTPDTDADDLPLTDRQHALLWLMTQGKTYDQTAAVFGVGRTTVQTQLARVYRKLGAANLASAVHEAHRQGYLSDDRWMREYVSHATAIR